MDDNPTEGKLFGTFEKQGDFVQLQQSLLILDLSVEPLPEEDRKELLLLRKLSEIVRLLPCGSDTTTTHTTPARRIPGAVVLA